MTRPLKRDRSSVTTRLSKLLMIGCASIHMGGMAYAGDTSTNYNIAPEMLESVLRTFAAQSDTQILFSTGVTKNLESSGLKGSYSQAEALDLLLGGSGLGYEIKGNGLLVINVAGKGLNKISYDTSEYYESNLGAYDEDEQSDEIDELDEIIVTGSRISRPASQVAAQVIVLDRAALVGTGEITLERALRQLPQNNFGTSEFGATLGSSLNGAINVTGGSTINLRGLGSEATLVLVDGRRIGQSGLFGGGSDISGIPLDSVERVEILLDGASSIYGSDAVGGVVNIILRKDYQGLEASYSVGLPGDGGFEEHVATLSGGTTWDRGRLRASYEFFKSTNLDGSERPSSAFGFFNSPANVRGGSPLFYRYQGQSYLPSALPVLPTADGVEAIFDAQIPGGQNGVGLTVADFTAFETVLGNNDVGRSLIPAQERHTFQGGIDQSFDAFGEEITFHADLYYSSKDIRSGTGAMTLQANVPTSNYILGGNPFNPFESAFEQTLVTWFIPELPNPYFETDQDVFRWNTGFDGAIGTWKWSLDGGQSREKINTTHFNSQVTFVEVDALLAGGLNLFASDLIEANGIDLVSQLQSDPLPASSINKQDNITFNLDGPLFTMPGGDVHMAVGGEWTKTTLDTQSQTSIGQGAVGGISIPTDPFDRTVVSTSRHSAYGELLVPLVGKDNAMTLIEQLTLTGSVRYDDYDTYGGATTWSVGAVWSPDHQIRFKFNRATSFVVPTPREGLIPVNVLDLSILPLGGFPRSIVDENGLSVGGVEIVAMQITGGNPDLEPETATSTSARVEITPDFIPGLMLGASWHKTSYDNRIGVTPISLGGVFLPDLENYPDLIYRNEMGNIVRDFRATNITAVEVEGIDYDIRYTRDTDIGQFSFNANIAYTSKWRQINSPGDEPLDLVGEFEGSSRNIIPRYRYSANLNWSNRGLALNFDASTSSDTATITGAGIGSFTSSGVQLGIAELVRRTNKSAFLADMSISYDFSEGDLFDSPGWLDGTLVSVRVVNLLNDQPKLEKTLDATGEAVTENLQFDYNANLADPRGRVFYLSLKKKF